MARKEVPCPAGCGASGHEYPGGLHEYDTYLQDHPNHINVSCPNCSRNGGPPDVKRFVEYWQGEGLELSQIREKIEEMKKEHKINQEELRHNKSLKDFWSS
jgi:hypothetical protein